MPDQEASVQVDRPIQAVYNQWTQFESFPHFMHGVDSVEQRDDVHSHWVVSIGGVTREFDTEITEQIPDERIAWKSTDGTSHAGVVTFHRLDDGVTKVMLQLGIEPEGIVEKAGTGLGIIQREAKGDLRRFKSFIESRPVETGAWRGEVGREQN